MFTSTRVTGCQGSSVIIDRSRRQVFRADGGKLQQMALVDAASQITWQPEVTKDIRDKTDELLTQQ